LDEPLRSASGRHSQAPTWGGWGPVAVLAVFILTRTVHPLLIRTLLGREGPGFEPLSVPLAECLVTLVLAQIVTVCRNGARAWHDLWRPRELSIFSAIGFMYAFGDYFELEMATLAGPIYKVLIQSKLLVTAGMVHHMKGQHQTLLQWIVLLLLMLALCCYEIMREMLQEHREMQSSPGWTAPAVEYTAIGILVTMAKVAVSCLGAVLLDKCMKDFKGVPIYMQLAQVKVGWLLGILAVTIFEGTWIGPDQFRAWRPPVVGALASFLAKSWSTIYLLAVLDALLKNICEAFAVVAAYFVLVFASNFDDEMENETLITVLVIGLVAAAYLVSTDGMYRTSPAPPV